MSLNQVGSRKPVSMYQFDPIWIVNEKQLKLPTHRFFLCLSIMKRIRKGSDLPKKKVVVTEHPTKIFAHQVNTKVISSIFCWVFDSVRTLEYDLACACLREMRSSNGRANVLKYVSSSPQRPQSLDVNYFWSSISLVIIGWKFFSGPKTCLTFTFIREVLRYRSRMAISFLQSTAVSSSPFDKHAGNAASPVSFFGAKIRGTAW